MSLVLNSIIERKLQLIFLGSELRRFAYVDFATPDAKTIAITMSENHLEGRKLLIKDGENPARTLVIYTIFLTSAIS